MDPWEQYVETHCSDVNNKSSIEYFEPKIKEDKCSSQNFDDKKNTIDESHNRCTHDSYSKPINTIPHSHSSSFVNITQSEYIPPSNVHFNETQSSSNTNSGNVIVPEEQNNCSTDSLNDTREINIPSEHIQNTSCTSNNSTLISWNLEQTDLLLTSLSETVSEVEANSNVNVSM